MAATSRALAATAAAVLVAQGVYTLIDAPNDVYAGSTADAVADSLLTAGALLIAAALAVASRRHSGATAGGLLGMAAGFTLIAVATLATVLAGEEKLDAVFVAGFGLVALSCLVVVARSLRGAPVVAGVAAALTLGLVIGLAFTSGGGIALAAACGFAALRLPSDAERALAA